MKNSIRQTEEESGAKPGTLESALIVAACIVLSPIVVAIAIIFH